MNERGRRTLVSRDVCEANSVATEGCVEQPTRSSGIVGSSPTIPELRGPPGFFFNSEIPQFLRL